MNNSSSSSNDNNYKNNNNCKDDADSTRAAAISTKPEEGNITAAGSILCSDDSSADFSSSNLNRIRGKQPNEHAGARPSANSAEKPALQVSKIAVHKAVRSFQLDPQEELTV